MLGVQSVASQDDGADSSLSNEMRVDERASAAAKRTADGTALVGRQPARGEAESKLHPAEGPSIVAHALKTLLSSIAALAS